MIFFPVKVIQIGSDEWGLLDGKYVVIAKSLSRENAESVALFINERRAMEKQVQMYQSALNGYASQLGISTDTPTLIDGIAGELALLNGTAGTMNPPPDRPLHEILLPK